MRGSMKLNIPDVPFHVLDVADKSYKNILAKLG
jgi:hypothetical protein